jgi:hypothetical protein
MSYELALAHLKEQYPGRLVLYPRDLAQILGRSELSVSHLLDRGHLPFKVKRVGRERCVDFFQVAQWLTAGAEEENPPKKPTVQGCASGVATKAARGQVAPLTPMMAELLQMRHDAPRAIARLAAKLDDEDERCFMVEVAQDLMFTRAAWTSQFVVTLKRQEVGPGGFTRADEQFYFDDYAGAETCIRNLQGTTYGEASARMQLRRGRKLLQHFAHLDGVWFNLS